jgi:hypothetical protein
MPKLFGLCKDGIEIQISIMFLLRAMKKIRRQVKNLLFSVGCSNITTQGEKVKID